MSALPPIADMLIVGINVCSVPEADITRAATGLCCAPRQCRLVVPQLPLVSDMAVQIVRPLGSFGLGRGVLTLA